MSPDQRFPKVARASSATIGKVSRGEHEPPRRPRRRGARQPQQPVTSIRVRPDVWERATALAEHPRNIQIISAEEVIVWNHPAPWPRRQS